MARQSNIHTVYHVMDAKGVFDNNPANPQAGQLYKKQQFPRLVYHPEGMTRVTKPAEELETKSGYKLVGEQSEIIWKEAANRKEYDRLIEAGWHAHPAGALRAAGIEPPPVSAAEQIDSLELEIARLKERLQDAKEYESATLGARRVRHDRGDDELEEEEDLVDEGLSPEALLSQRQDDDAPDIDPHAGGAPPAAVRRSAAAEKLAKAAS